MVEINTGSHKAPALARTWTCQWTRDADPIDDDDDYAVVVGWWLDCRGNEPVVVRSKQTGK